MGILYIKGPEGWVQVRMRTLRTARLAAALLNQGNTPAFARRM